MHPSRNNIIWRDQNQCQYCEVIEPSKELTIDHILPRSRGGGNIGLILLHVVSTVIKRNAIGPQKKQT